MEVRLATLNDVDALRPLLTEFFAYNANLQPLYCYADDESGEYPKNMIENDNADFLIALDKDIAVGFIHISQMKTPPYGSVIPHNYAEIMAFMVTASRRGQGIGSKLIDAAKQWSKDRNLDYIELISFTNADAANSFYDSKDFATVLHLRRHML
ncbi:MAG: GNAT family N-acetyltransferase [Defluviitaleaceae bacterium]|nr:GNAT family N-acetyltransferase [Defluviitaleaceae bacterium]